MIAEIHLHRTAALRTWGSLFGCPRPSLMPTCSTLEAGPHEPF